jgi:hypothetical protein
VSGAVIDFSPWIFLLFAPLPPALISLARIKYIVRRD